jgi:hypothetical protein
MRSCSAPTVTLNPVSVTISSYVEQGRQQEAESRAKSEEATGDDDVKTRTGKSWRTAAQADLTTVVADLLSGQAQAARPEAFNWP